MDVTIIFNEWSTYWQGFYTTVWLVALSLVMGLLVAVPLAIMRNSRYRFLKTAAWAYIYFFRGTPLLVQLFLIYYGAGQWQWLRESVAWELFSQAWFCAILAFTLNTSAYTAEIIRGAINAMPAGQLRPPMLMA